MNQRLSLATLICFFTMLTACMISHAQGAEIESERAPVPLEVYGRLPSIEDVSLSPSGNRLAYVSITDNLRAIIIYDLVNNKKLVRIDAGRRKLRQINWADEDNLMIHSSQTSQPYWLDGDAHEWSQLQVYNLPKRRTRIVPDDRHIEMESWQKPMNVVAGRVMTRHVNGQTLLFVPGIYLNGQGRAMLVQANLNKDEQKVVAVGQVHNQYWFVNEAGEVVADQGYDAKGKRWSFKLRINGVMKSLPIHEMGLSGSEIIGFGKSPDSILLRREENERQLWHSLSLRDGKLSEPMADAAIFDTVLEHVENHLMIGGAYVDDDSHYLFFDSNLQKQWNSILKAYGGDRVSFESASADYKRIAVKVEGPHSGFKYQVVDLEARRTIPIGDVYEGVDVPLEVRRITYPAKDGMAIPAYLTLPPVDSARRLPLIVLPHGGPTARDTADFDWWSQALAEQGYAVLRPNYRGSTVSADSVLAGYGEFGRKMQSDLVDGVNYLRDQGLIDSARVCIVGASYGGYAALSGASQDPDVYRCAASVSGVTDLQHFFDWIAKQYGDDDRKLRFLNKLLAASGPTDPVLASLSPAQQAHNIKAPILLIHGEDDTVVPFEQSKIMSERLRKAGKQVELIRLDGEDHWLSRGETRLQMLQALIRFLQRYNPTDQFIMAPGSR